MAKFRERIRARKLRTQGLSVKNIATQLKVSKSTASLWVRDIILSLEQLEKLQQRRIKAGEKGRLLGAFKQKMIGYYVSQMVLRKVRKLFLS